MNRFLVAIIAALAFAMYRGNPAGVIPIPVPAVVVPASIPSLTKYRDTMTKDDRAAISQAYAVLARTVAANPVDDPVIPSTQAVFDVHRAAMLFVWRGVMGNVPGKYEGLREELEGLVRDKVGSADVPLNPALQRDTAALFDEISRSLR